ncbi:uncharacterized protein FOBCDRAFT_217206 [Fusarium oxysporum Fo47]|uniref:uncharacterized protein n=1 Tax=Fusarium oxysporum Fo47 TaxID=660027 RepID=UPI002869B3E8|nr:uncharacterized protein FOBCDRAFT_217206 [Fusarium oxysporum Fo47]WJG34946.1 hypothetical protein FOBCDRAFT_217206 [Fusarium oxysporum Fo47]
MMSVFFFFFFFNLRSIIRASIKCGQEKEAHRFLPSCYLHQQSCHRRGCIFFCSVVTLNCVMSYHPLILVN